MTYFEVRESKQSKHHEKDSIESDFKLICVLCQFSNEAVVAIVAVVFERLGVYCARLFSI